MHARLATVAASMAALTVVATGPAHAAIMSASSPRGGTGASSHRTAAQSTVGAPSNLTYTRPSPTEADLSWTPPSDAQIASYTVYVSPPLHGTSSEQVTAPSATLTGLLPDVGYLVYVTATDTSGNTSAPSPTISIGTPFVPPTVTVALNGTTTFKTTPGSAKLTGQLSLTPTATNPVAGSATLNLDTTTAGFTLFGAIPVTAQVTFETTGSPTFTVSGSTAYLSSQVIAKIPSVTLFGTPVGGGASCQTAAPINIAFQFPYPVPPTNLTATYTIPALQNCGPLTTFLSSHIAGPGNTISLQGS